MIKITIKLFTISQHSFQKNEVAALEYWKSRRAKSRQRSLLLTVLVLCTGAHLCNFSRLNAHEFEQAPGDGEGPGNLACCSPWGHKESDTTQRLNNNSYHKYWIFITSATRRGLYFTSLKLGDMYIYMCVCVCVCIYSCFI